MRSLRSRWRRRMPLPARCNRRRRRLRLLERRQPRVAERVCRREPPRRIGDEQPAHEVLRHLADAGPLSVLVELDGTGGEGGGARDSGFAHAEWVRSREHRKREHAGRPQVALAAVWACAGHLRRHVLGRAAEAMQRGSRFQPPRRAKIDELRSSARHLLAEHHILALDVAVHDALLVQVRERLHHVAENCARALLRKRATVLEQRLHVAAIEPLEHDGDALRVADDWRLLNRHDARVVQHAQQLDLHAQRVEDLGSSADRGTTLSATGARDLRSIALNTGAIEPVDDPLNVVDVAPDARVDVRLCGNEFASRRRVHSVRCTCCSARRQCGATRKSTPRCENVKGDSPRGSPGDLERARHFRLAALSALTASCRCPASQHPDDSGRERRATRRRRGARRGARAVRLLFHANDTYDAVPRRPRRVRPRRAPHGASDGGPQRRESLDERAGQSDQDRPLRASAQTDAAFEA